MAQRHRPCRSNIEAMVIHYHYKKVLLALPESREPHESLACPRSEGQFEKRMNP